MDAEIASFKTTECYQHVKERLRMFFLRGNIVDPVYLREVGALNRIIEVKSDVQAINILGYLLNKPMANFDNQPAEKLDKLLWQGNVCFINEESRKELAKIVKQMRSYRFELIPLIMVTKRHKTSDTLLIKVHERLRNSYVDMCGRIYSSFENFLEDNKLPPSFLCYPKGGIVSFDESLEIEADCSVVGTTNAIKGTVDVLVGMVGVAGAVGTIFATGGLATPFALVTGGSALYAAGRSVEKLVDAGTHGMPLNPFEDAEARNNWLMMSANLLTFASLGVTGLAAKLEGVTATQVSRLVLANRIIRGVSAGVNAVTAIDSIAYLVNNWKKMTIYEKLSVACAVCFCFREVISFAHAERLIRNCQIDGICKFFKGCSDSVVGGTTTVGHFLTNNVKRIFDNNDEYVETGMKLISTIVRESILDVTVSDDFYTIRLFGFEFKMKNIISMQGTELNKFLYMLQGITKGLRDGFALLRTICGDGPIAKAVFKRAEEAGGNRGDYGNAINELIEVFMLLRRITNDISILTDAQLTIGGGHRFTVASAYRTFVNTKGISLLRALLEMNQREINRMNILRTQWASQEVDIFNFITQTSMESSDMLVMIRFLLSVFEICTEKSLRLTRVEPAEKTIEIESLIRADPDQWHQSAYQDYLIDPKFFQICQAAQHKHYEFLSTIWRNTCVNSGTFDRAFEKLTILETAFQSISPTTIANVISYVSINECPDLARFTPRVLFALRSMENLTREMGLEESAVNEALFTGSATLQSRFLELTMKAEQLSLGGYCPTDVSGDADPKILIESIKALASKTLLRFGPTENGALHLEMYPMLRLGSEIRKFNRYIELKKFSREEVKIAYDGKWMLYLENEQLRIIVGVVRGLGAYIDAFLFTHV